MPSTVLLPLCSKAVCCCRAAKRSKAAGIADGTIVFKQADMLKLGSKLGDCLWETVLDSALLHCFPPEVQPRYLAELQSHVRHFYLYSECASAPS